MHIKLSVIITCYNLGAYLEEALKSVLDYEPIEAIEIIIVNDGSDASETLKELKNIELKYTDVLVLNQTNQGLAKARNNGIKIANGKYIIPLDADNKLRPIFLEKAIAILDTNQEIDVVHGNAQNFGCKTTLWESKPFDFKEMVLNNYIDACACFRKSAWEELNGFDEQMPVMGFEDWDLWLRMASRGYQFEYVSEIFFDYRVRENSMLTDAWKKRDELLKYIFTKKELLTLGGLRESLIENQRLMQEQSVKSIIKILINKALRKFK